VQSNKTVVIFLIKFFGTYLLLFLGYSTYLDKTQKTNAGVTCAPITKTVAEQTKYLINSIGYNAEVEQQTNEIYVNLFVNNKLVARVIEGCNSMSIIILFISFIVAFSGNFKTTFLYIIFGSLLIYFFNIFRIAIISIALYKYPQYQYMLHDILFPILIYGITFLLWFIWVQKFSKIKR